MTNTRDWGNPIKGNITSEIALFPIWTRRHKPIPGTDGDSFRRFRLLILELLLTLLLSLLHCRRQGCVKGWFGVHEIQIVRPFKMPVPLDSVGAQSESGLVRE